MPASVLPKSDNSTRTIIGWQGIRFNLPADWNVTGFSMSREEGYLKVDSPGTMFVQLKWNDPGLRRPRTLAEVVWRMWRRARKQPAAAPKPPDLRVTLDAFIKQTGKLARKAKANFDYKVKPETTEAGGERTAHHFSWTGGGQGQGKIWHCKTCGRVVIAQVVGQPKDNVSDVAALLFSTMCDHPQEGWTTWALYDLVAGIPENFALKSQKLMSGYLRLEFERRGGERIVVERWGLANITRKKFTLKEWFLEIAGARSQRMTTQETTAHGHEAVRATGSVRGPLAWFRALRDAAFTFRPATRYDGGCWECPDSNKLYAIQVWHNVRSIGLLDEAVARCECH
jgi:hypothetical protein